MGERHREGEKDGEEGERGAEFSQEVHMTLAFFSEDDLAEKLKNIGALIPFSKLASQLRVQHEEVAESG